MVNPSIRPRTPQTVAAYEESRVDFASDLAEGAGDSPASPGRGPGRGPDHDTARAQRTPAPFPLASTSHEGADRPGPGSVLGVYRLLELVSDGSTSQVFRAWHGRLPVPVAVKVLTNPDSLARAQMRNEAAVLAWVHHPNVLRLWDFDEDGPFPHLVTEFVDGQTLARYIEQHGRLDPRWLTQVLCCIVQGLAASSALGVVHRDVKPSNILIPSSGSVKLCDFGLATVSGQRLRGVMPIAPAAGVLGTPAYIAPEQARDPSSVDFRADIYSLGATAWHALTGQLPFSGRSALEVVYKHIHEPPTPPIRLVPTLPPALSDAVLKMMAPRPQDRFQKYDELLRALASCVR